MREIIGSLFSSLFLQILSPLWNYNLDRSGIYFSFASRGMIAADDRKESL